MSKSNDVYEFHRTAAPNSAMSRFRSVPGLPSADHRAHLLALVTEKYADLVTGLTAQQNLPDSADALLGIIYVCFGGLLSMGLTPDEIDILWNEVHRTKMHNEISKPPGFLLPDIEGLVNAMRRSRDVQRGG